MEVRIVGEKWIVLWHKDDARSWQTPRRQYAPAPFAAKRPSRPRVPCAPEVERGARSDRSELSSPSGDAWTSAAAPRTLGDLHHVIQILNELQEPVITAESMVLRDDLAK